MKSQKTNGVEVSKDEEEGRAKARPYMAKEGERTGEIDAKAVWIQLEDEVVPRLRLSVIDRVVYAHLLRLSRLVGKRRVRFSIASVARGTRVSCGPVRQAVRHLVTQGALRLIARSKAGHVVEVRLPEEIPAARRERREASALARIPQVVRLEETDFMQTKELREAIHAREKGRCFYCLRRLTPTVRCVDHVVPQAQSGRNSYRNLVGSCLECNSQKGERPAEDFVRWLYRERRLTATELADRLRALDALAGGKLKPEVGEGNDKTPRRE
jgi:5-methylcytosine-specific restriction endonuclease McrA